MAKAIDLTNQRFGRLLVIERDAKKDPSRQARWICKCDCGNITSVLGHSLRSGNTLSCGCYGKEKRETSLNIWRNSEENKKHCKNISNKLDLTNQRFGKLTVLKKTDIRKNKQVVWKCLCDCGSTTYVTADCLQKGDTKSCGCIKSFGEEKISQLLNEANIIFEREKQFNNCIFSDSNKNARFDFYVNNQYLIEFDGKQHFEQNKFFNEPLENIKQRDLYKNKWCKENNIPLIRIPYTHLDNLCIEDLLLETSKYIIY